MNLKNKIIVITGSSKGLGKSLAQILVHEEAQVIVNSQNETDLKELAKDISCDYFVADVSKFDDVKKLGEYIFNEYGKLDIWVNNAGIQIAPGPIESVSTDQLQRLFGINFFGYFYGCQIALTYMKKQNNGLIININSSAGLEGKSQISAYSSSKFAVRGLSESLRKEVQNSNIKIFNVFPGGIKTEIYKEKYPADFDAYMEVDSVTKKIVDNLKSDNPEQDLLIKRPIK